MCHVSGRFLMESIVEAGVDELTKPTELISVSPFSVPLVLLRCWFRIRTNSAMFKLVLLRVKAPGTAAGNSFLSMAFL